PAASAGVYPGRGVLEHRARFRTHAETVGRGEERVRRGLPAQVLRAHGRAVDDHLDVVRETGDVEDLPGVGAGGDHRPAQAGVPGRLQVGPRALEHPHAVLVDLPQQQLVLAVAQAVHGLRVRRVVRVAVRQLDAAAGEEGPHAVRARPAVDV